MASVPFKIAPVDRLRGRTITAARRTDQSLTLDLGDESRVLLGAFASYGGCPRCGHSFIAPGVTQLLATLEYAERRRVVIDLMGGG